jgi:spermidine synthase
MVALLAVASVAEAKTIHTERPLYQNILVTQQGDLRCLKFTARRNERRQSCIDLKQPERLVFTYTRMMLAGLLVVEDPARILVIGLGGGTLPTLLGKLFTEAQITVVEIDPAVVKVAQRYFDYVADHRTQVIEQDARVYGKRAGLNGEQFDLVLLDAFNSDYIPEHLMTREYLEETRVLLAPGGALVSNTFIESQLYDYESVTYESVFGSFLNLRTPDSSNRVIIARNGPLPSNDSLEAAASRWHVDLERYGVPIDRYPAYLSREPDWDRETRVLTDQYSPANLLRGLP